MTQSKNTQPMSDGASASPAPRAQMSAWWPALWIAVPLLLALLMELFRGGN